MNELMNVADIRLEWRIRHQRLEVSLGVRPALARFALFRGDAGIEPRRTRGDLRRQVGRSSRPMGTAAAIRIAPAQKPLTRSGDGRSDRAGSRIAAR